MFPIGTQITMLMSTANKKLSPRRGSIGYVSGCGETTLLTKNYEKGVTTTPIHIIFTKYGNEAKSRKEKRVILNVIPTELDNSKPNSEKSIKTLKGNFRKNPAFLKRQIKIDGATCAGTIIPNNTFHNIVESKEIEKAAWVESHISHYYFNKVMPTILKRLKYPAKFIHQLTTEYRKIDIQDVITAIRATSVTYSTRNYSNYLIALKQMLESSDGGMYRQHQRFFSIYSEDLFDEEKSEEKEGLIKKSGRLLYAAMAANTNEMSKALIKLKS